MTIIRTVGSTDTYLSSASKFGVHAQVEPTSGLTGASVTGGIIKGANRSTITLTLTQAKCMDEGRYTCKLDLLKSGTVHRVHDRKYLTIFGEALT